MHAFYSFTQPVTQLCIVQEVVMLLLSYDACATVINGTAQIPKDVTQNGDIKNMLGGNILTWCNMSTTYSE